MALIFSLFARCRDGEAAARLIAHFQGLRWTLADGTETVLDGGPYSAAIASAPPGACWVTPTAISTGGIRDEHDALQMTELGNRLCEHLRSAPAFEMARVGIEVDHVLEDDELIEMFRDHWSGLIVNDDLYQRAGAPPACSPFREGMWWFPYDGEWRATYRRHAPDTLVVGCLGCGEAIQDHHLVRLEEHGHSPCCVWHPYHLWCIRDAPPAAAAITECADCGGPLDLEQMRGTLRWGAATTHHVHKRAIDVEAPHAVTQVANHYAGKPLGVSRRSVVTAGVDAIRQSPHDLHELVHDECPDGPDEWRRRLRASPGDRELRRVYADHLEQLGDLERANVTRLVIDVPAPEHARARAEELRRVTANVSRGWLRDVCR